MTAEIAEDITAQYDRITAAGPGPRTRRADTAGQRAARESMRQRGEQLAPRINPQTGKEIKSQPAPREQRTQRAPSRKSSSPVAQESRERTGDVLSNRGERSERRESRGRSNNLPSFSLGNVGKDATSTLIAEYLFAVVVIFLSVFTGSSLGYAQQMSSALWRVTAVTAIFFVLSLAARGGKSGKVATAFGLIIDLGVLFEAVKSDTIKTAGDILSGKGSGVNDTTLTSDITGEPDVHEIEESWASTAPAAPTPTKKKSSK